ncbi:MAG: DUF2141 domain-containing protein [Bacteroidota bacterium]
MRKTLISLSFILPLLTVNLYSQTAKPGETLTIHVSGFEKHAGQVLVCLYRKGDKVPMKPFMQVKGEIINKASDIIIPGIPYGEYAAIVVHDLNSNGRIDHKWGIPAEPMGYTNNWKLGLFSGMPTFEKLKFIFSATRSTIVVKMDE